MASSALEKIIVNKQREVDQLLHQGDPAFHELLLQKHPCSGAFQKSLLTEELGVIAEIKRRSPSVGDIKSIPAPQELALRYANGGASAISVLTDRFGFGGQLSDLTQVAAYVSIPLLRKEFILHPIQLAESVFVGAQVVLLIAAVFGNRLLKMVHIAHQIGLEALVEVHTESELSLSLDAGARIIGVNQRNLKTFEMSPEVFAQLKPKIPSSIVAVAESGIHTLDQANHVRDLGYHAILVGEALVRSADPAQLIRQFRTGVV